MSPLITAFPRQPRSLAGRLAHLDESLLRPHHAVVAAALAALILQSLLTLPLPWLQGRVIDLLASQESIDSDLHLGWLLGQAVVIPLGCLLVRTLLGWTAGVWMNRVSLEFVRGLTDRLHRKLHRLPLAWFDRQETGELMARLTSDAGTLLIFLSASSLQLVADLVLAAGIVLVLAVLSWPLAIFSLAVLPFFWMTYRWHAPRISLLARQVQQQNAAVCSLLSERLSAIRTVRASGGEPGELARFQQRLDDQTDCGRESLKANCLQQLTASLIGGIAGGVVMCAAALMVQQGWLSLGQAAAFIAYLALLYQPLVRLVQFCGGIAATLAAVERISEVLEEPEPPAAGCRPLPRVRGAIQFRNVSFRYRPCVPLALDRIHLRIEPGTTVGICGSSGAGKTTLLSLVPRLYEQEMGQGRILLDGRDIRSFRPAELRKHVRYVPQQARLFEGTIRSNLAYAAGTIDDELLWQALQCVDLAELVRSLPLGLDSAVVERGTSLSGGQRQRLALARALIGRPEVLLLDDCLSALDAETAVCVWERMSSLRPQQTRLVASNHPQALASCHWLVWLDQGRIIRQGTPSRLLTALEEAAAW